MRNSIGSILAVVVLFSLMVPLASAYSNIGMALSEEKFSTCPADTKTLYLTLTNNDDKTHAYSLSLELPQGWTSPSNGFIQPDATLASGETKTIMFWINPPAVEPGIYQASVKAKAGIDEATKAVGIEVLTCHNVAITAEEAVDVCADSQFQYTFGVTNNGKTAEEFEIIVSGSWGAELHKETVSIDAGKTKNFAIDVSTPLQSGKITVKAASKSSYAKSEASTQVNVNKCYDFSMSLEPAEAIACMGGSSKFVLTIKNLGTSGDVYLISAPDWVTPSQDNITIIQGEERSVGLFAYPEAKGKSAFTIVVSSKGYPKLAKNSSATVETNECKGVAVIVAPSAQEICGGLTADFTVTVKNTGMGADAYDIRTSLGTLENEKISVDSGDIKEIKLSIDTKTLQPGETLVTVAAKSGDISDQNSAKLTVKNCYSAEFGVSPEKAEICAGDELQYTIVFKNTGQFAENYTLGVEDKDIGMISLSPGELKTFSTTFKMDFPEGQHNITFRLQSDYVSKEAVSMITVKPKEKCYNVEISSEGAVSMVEAGKGLAIAAKIKNSGEKPENYVLSLEAPAWFHISEDSLALKAGEEATVYLYASPGFDVNKSVYSASLKAASANVEKQMLFRIGVGVMPEPVKEEGAAAGKPKMPTGMIVSFASGRVILLALIVLVILIILVVKFVLLVR